MATPIIDAAPSARGYTYQTHDNEHHSIVPGSELTYVGDEVGSNLARGMTYVFDGKDGDYVNLINDRGEVVKVLRETFLSYLHFRAFNIH